MEVPSNTSASGVGIKVYLRLVQYLTSFKTMLIASIVASLLYGATGPAYAKMVQYFIDYLYDTNVSDLLYLIPLGMVGLAALRGVTLFVSSYYLGRIGESVIHQIRIEMFDKILHLPQQYFDQTDSGRIISKIIYNVQLVNDSVSNVIIKLLQDGALAIGLLVYLLWLDWKLSLTFIAVGLPVGFLASYVGKKLRKISHSIQTAMGELTHVSNETINAQQLIRGYGGTKWEYQRFVKASHENLQRAIKLIRTKAATSPIAHLIAVIGVAIIFFIILGLKDGSGNASEYVGFILAVGLLPAPIRTLGDLYGRIMRSVAAAESIFELIDETPELDNGTHHPNRIKGHINIDNLSFSYGGELVIENISLNIKAGDNVALVGRSGSGKTTLASLLMRFYETQSGSIRFDNTPISDYSLQNLRKQIAYVSQHSILFNDSILNNIAYGDMQNCDSAKVQAAIKAARVDKFTENLNEGIDTLVGEDGMNLSGGQRQRIAIARAILRDAPILILDEATSALDNESERHIQAALEDLMRDRTTIVIAHRLSTIENASNIVVLNRGKIIEQGTHNSLLELKGQYAKLYNSESFT